MRQAVAIQSVTATMHRPITNPIAKRRVGGEMGWGDVCGDIIGSSIAGERKCHRRDALWFRVLPLIAAWSSAVLLPARAG